MIRRLGVVESTNDAAAAWAREGAPHGALVVADAQTRGRGRIGRTWESPAGGNLYGSVVLRPARPPEALAGLTLCAAVAVVEAIEGLPGRPGLGIKWPNDLLLDGRKVGGVLAELHNRGPGAPYVIAGIGLNLATSPEGLAAADLGGLPTGPADRDAVAEAVRAALVAWAGRFDAGGFAAVRSAWLRRWADQGRRVRASIPGTAGVVEGVALDVDAEGALLIDVGAGAARAVRVTAGDVESV